MAAKSQPLPQPWPPQETFWDRLQRLRNAMGVENAQVAEAAGVAVGTVSNWKQGRTPETEAVLRLARFFHVTVEWLLTGEEGKEKRRALQVRDEVPVERHGQQRKRKGA